MAQQQFDSVAKMLNLDPWCDRRVALAHARVYLSHSRAHG
jgi:hypothetical protein